MRVLLAALEQARANGCQVAVFPELPLTGSVDPRRHPERAVAIDAEPVRALLEGTWRTGVAAVFGIAERGGGGVLLLGPRAGRAGVSDRRGRQAARLAAGQPGRGGRRRRHRPAGP